MYAPNSYLLLFRENSPEVYKVMSSEQRQTLMNQWNSWYDGLEASGKVQHGHPLEPDGRVVASRGDRLVDGPFVESKEAIGGYFFLSVADLEEATEIAKQCPSLKYGLSVEVRPVADCCRVLRVAGRKPKQEVSPT